MAVKVFHQNHEAKERLKYRDVRKKNEWRNLTWEEYVVQRQRKAILLGKVRETHELF